MELQKQKTLDKKEAEIQWFFLYFFFIMHNVRSTVTQIMTECPTHAGLHSFPLPSKFKNAFQ